MNETKSLARGLGMGALLLVGLVARPSQARLIDLHAGVRAGGMTGWGTTANTPDFFDRRKGFGPGFDLGVKLLIFDLSANFLQIIDSHGRAGTLEQVLFGINIDVPVGNDKFQQGIEKGKSRNIIRPLLNFGLATGTPEPVVLPIDNAQLSDKGIVSYFGCGYEHFLNEFLGVGAQVDYGYHYFVGGGKSTTAAQMMLAANQTHSSGYQLDAFGTLTFHLGY